MGLFRKNQEDEYNMFETSDILIVFDDEMKTTSIDRVTDITAEYVMAAGKHKVPIEDCEVTTGREGRVYFYRAPSQSVKETERLAMLEQTMVLEQITAYKPPIPPSTMDWTKGLLFGLVFIAFIVMGVTSCSGAA